MKIPELKVWCEGLALYKVKTTAGYGEDKYVIATDFNDAAEKVRQSYVKAEEAEIAVVANAGNVGMGHISSAPKGKNVKVKEVELIAENVIL